MKDGITLHPEHGLNPSIEVCMICGEEMGIALLGNNIKGQAPHHICTGGVCDNCKKIIDDGGCFIIEVEDGSDQKNPYRTGRYCAIKKSMATEPEEEWRIYGWFGSISPETKEVRLNIVKDIYTAKADELYHHVLDKFGWA